jgi:hypothetical protein
MKTQLIGAASGILLLLAAVIFLLGITYLYTFLRLGMMPREFLATLKSGKSMLVYGLLLFLIAITLIFGPR